MHNQSCVNHTHTNKQTKIKAKILKLKNKIKLKKMQNTNKKKKNKKIRNNIILIKHIRLSQTHIRTNKQGCVCKNNNKTLLISKNILIFATKLGQNKKQKKQKNGVFQTLLGTQCKRF